MRKKVNKEIFASYLAGLWEGVGHIGIAKNNIRPYFAITFHIKDKPLAKKLQELLGGTLRFKQENNAIVLTIRAQVSLLNICLMLNGKIRSPKIYEFNKLIEWLNSKTKNQIPILEIDSSSLESNSWLAGFIDADGSFKIRYQFKKIDTITNKILSKGRIAVSFVLEHRKEHPKTKDSFFSVMSSIASFFYLPNSSAKVYESKHNEIYYYKIEVSSLDRLKLLHNYLLKYSLLSSKQNDFVTWSKVLELIEHGGHLEETVKKQIFSLKQQINNKRQTYNWEHLENLES